MNKDEIKIYLKDNPEYIQDILEDLGCNHVKITKDKMVQSTRPGGDNKTAICIKLNDFLSSTIYTKNEFESYEIKDFFTLIEYLKECDFGEAIDYICTICNIERTKNNSKKKIVSGSYSFLKKYKNAINKNNLEEIEETVLPESYCERFVQCPHKQYLDDGVSYETQIKFGISYDVLGDRVVTPIRNEEGKLLTFKGRTCKKDYKSLGISKFVYYYPLIGEHYVFGLYENYFDIMLADEVIIFESEKAVMQCDSVGIKNVISINKKRISDTQLKKILKLGKKVVLAFDKDVTKVEMQFECRKFRGLIELYYIYDDLDLLDSKDSPIDKGKEVFEKLLKECKYKYKGE